MPKSDKAVNLKKRVETNLNRNKENETDYEDDISLLIECNVKKDTISSVENILPTDSALLTRSMKWAKLIEKFEDSFKSSPGYYDVDGISITDIPVDDNGDEDDEPESDYSSSFEDNNFCEDPDFNVAKTVNETLPIVEKRKENWHKYNNLDKSMDTFSSSKILEVSKWLNISHNTSSYKLFDQINDDNSSCCSLELTQYLKKHSCPKMNFSKFNQRIKLNKTRNSLSLNKCLNKCCEFKLNCCDMDRRTYFDPRFEFYNSPHHPFQNDYFGNSNRDISRRHTFIPDIGELYCRNNRLSMYDPGFYNNPTIHSLNRHSDVPKLRSRNLDIEKKKKIVKPFYQNDDHFFDQKKILNSTTYSCFSGNKSYKKKDILFPVLEDPEDIDTDKETTLKYGSPQLKTALNRKKILNKQKLSSKTNSRKNNRRSISAKRRFIQLARIKQLHLNDSETSFSTNSSSEDESVEREIGSYKNNSYFKNKRKIVPSAIRSKLEKSLGKDNVETSNDLLVPKHDNISTSTYSNKNNTKESDTIQANKNYPAYPLQVRRSLSDSNKFNEEQILNTSKKIKRNLSITEWKRIVNNDYSSSTDSQICSDSQLNAIDIQGSKNPEKQTVLLNDTTTSDLKNISENVRNVIAKKDSGILLNKENLSDDLINSSSDDNSILTFSSDQDDIITLINKYTPKKPSKSIKKYN